MFIKNVNCVFATFEKIEMLGQAEHGTFYASINAVIVAILRWVENGSIACD
jgi:hypothetical protein